MFKDRPNMNKNWEGSEKDIEKQNEAEERRGDGREIWNWWQSAKYKNHIA